MLIAGACAGDEDSGAAADPSTASSLVDEPSGPAPDMEAVSARAEYVTGDSVVLAVHGSDDAASLTVGGIEQPLVDATPQRTHDAGPPAGLEDARLIEVTGLVPGDTSVVISGPSGESELDLTVHPVTGPIFSGPHQEPYICTAEGFGLGPPDEDCHAEPIRRQRYLKSDGMWAEVESDDDIDGRQVSTGGTGVPVVVDVEIGTLNRAVYEFAVPQGWNGLLVYTFGGGCGTGYWQGTFLGSEPIGYTELLAAGYAVASSTLNTFQTTCNDVVSAETVMMVKEHFIETFGVPRWTIGQGGSGGAIQQYLIAQNYPGLLDALNPLVSFPDAVSIAPGVTDCGLLESVLGHRRRIDLRR